MLFNSWVFVAFIAIVLPIYYLLNRRGQNVFLVAMSYVFYGWWDYRFLSLLFISTVLDYTVARFLDATNDPRKRKLLVSISIAGNMGMLGFFKYYNFFVESAVEALQSIGFNPTPQLIEVVLPVGISFYSFQTLSYALDVYRKELPACRSLVDFALYVAYFPQLVAGPIERATRLLPQIQSQRHVGQEQWNSGLQLMLWGYVKKVAVADSLAPYVDEAFKNPSALDSLTLLLCVYAFAFQIYCDFSGYTDIARGLSRLMGIELMENFKQPYLARNITEFWRRWHISLSTWLRDYVYIPLGGNRLGTRMQYQNLFLTMLIGGLWHGANWTFVIWGALHGVFLAVHKWATGNRRIGIEAVPAFKLWPRYFVSGVVTFHLVCFAWIFFRANNLNHALDYIQYLCWNSEPLGAALNQQAFLGLADAVFFYAALVVFLDISSWRHGGELPFTERNKWWVRGIAYAIGLLILMLVREDVSGQFIYFQF